MPRVAGIDPGTLSIDVCGLDDGRLFLDATWPTAELARRPAPLLDALLERADRSIWWPARRATACRCARPRDVTDDELRLAFLAPPGETGRHRRPAVARAPARRGGRAALCSRPA